MRLVSVPKRMIWEPASTVSVRRRLRRGLYVFIHVPGHAWGHHANVEGRPGWIPHRAVGSRWVSTSTSGHGNPTSAPAPPPPPVVTLSSSQVDAGATVKVTVSTVPGASVTTDMTVKQQGLVVFGAEKGGTANSKGTWAKSIRVTYHPTNKVTGHITVQVETDGGTAHKTIKVAVVPHA